MERTIELADATINLHDFTGVRVKQAPGKVAGWYYQVSTDPRARQRGPFRSEGEALASAAPRKLFHGVYNARHPTYQDKGALLRWCGPGVFLVQFDDLKLPEAHGWTKFPSELFDVKVPSDEGLAFESAERVSKKDLQESGPGVSDQTETEAAFDHVANAMRIVTTRPLAEEKQYRRRPWGVLA